MLKFLSDLLKLSNHYSTTSRGSKSPECSWHLGGTLTLCFVKNQLTLYHHIFFICILRLILRNFPKVFRIKWSCKTNAQRNVRKLLVVVRAIGFTNIGDQSKRLAHASSALPLSNRQRQVLRPCHWLLDLTSVQRTHLLPVYFESTEKRTASQLFWGWDSGNTETSWNKREV